MVEVLELALQDDQALHRAPAEARPVGHVEVGSVALGDRPDGILQRRVGGEAVERGGHLVRELFAARFLPARFLPAREADPTIGAPAAVAVAPVRR